uniref:Uncharacterized protein n=1 Tax=Xenopus tropicalis TaxID=8364 RepID=A0A803JBZ5_XENTR
GKYTAFYSYLIRKPSNLTYQRLDGDGVLSMYELEYIYEEQIEKMEAIGIEPLPFKICCAKKYLDHEQRNLFAVQKDDRYAAEEYEILFEIISPHEQHKVLLSNKNDKLVISALTGAPTTVQSL